MQVTKYLVPRIRQWDRTDVAALAVINQQRALPALQRQNIHTFQDDVLANAEHQGFGLLTTLDLFRLVRNKVRWAWPDETVAHLFYSHGRISAIPSHYALVGVIDGFFEQAEAVCIRVTGEEFQVGDRLAFLLPIEYLEHPVESIQQDNAAVHRAPIGAHVGVKTPLSKQQARNGVLVYRVGSSGSQGHAPTSDKTDEPGSAAAA